MQPTLPEAHLEPDVPKLKPTVYCEAVAELAAEPPCDSDVHLSHRRSTN